FNVSWTVTNTGDAPVSNWTDRVSLSVDQGIGGDQQLGEFPFAGVLLPGQSVTRTQGAVPPISLSGERYVVVAADPQDIKPESNELNNAAISAQSVNVRLAPIPDLRVANVTTSATERDLHEPLLVEWVVTNHGTGATDSPFWRDEV